jgi:formate dehydrogenase major subunit
MEKGATMINVDPRFTRTSSKADIYTALRSGTDIAFLGGMIKYILENKLYSQEYVSLYTNAPFIVGRKYGFKNGLFSGYEKNPKGPSMGKYDKSQWAFEMDKNGVPKMDRSLKHKRSVFQLLKKALQPIRFPDRFQDYGNFRGRPEAGLRFIQRHR